MASNTEIIKTLSILELLSEKDKYVIPIYQRNYAWDKPEITQLIQDIIDKSKDADSNYYLGTLIVDNKSKNNQDYFEIIDGQQRHTTLTLINAFLNRNKDIKVLSNLYFDARPLVKQFIDAVYKNYENASKTNQNDDSLNNITRGIGIIDSFFASNIDLRGEKIDKEQLKSYFNNNVKIIRVNVPNNTDINHYFEIMNTRGVQLEKHQILKAAFIENIYKMEVEEKDKLSQAFGVIWDACSSMDKYIYYCFKPGLRESLFGNNWIDIPTDGIERIKKTFDIKSSEKEEIRSLLNILEGKFDDIKSNLQDSPNQLEGKYTSIIDFPNFLLQVLKLYKKDSAISLDDKNLLKSFGYDSKELPNSIEFINFLLKIRTLFDKYIIKRQIDDSNEVKWKILKPSESPNDYLVNTFSEEDYKILMIQSMFQVSFANNSYKNWLYDLLDWINKNEFNSIGLFDFSLNNAKKLYKNSSKDNEWFNKGVGINNYIFNYADFILWLAYNTRLKNTHNFEKETIFEKMSIQRRYFENFKFAQRSSVEHVHPQSKINELKDANEEEKNTTLNCFGNVCLISRSSNSKYSDYNFNAKKEQFEKRKTAESLKQAIMYAYEDWNTQQIKEHGEQMIDLLNKSLIENTPPV